MTNKSFPIALAVVPLTPEDDYFIDIDPIDQEVDKGDIARFVIILSGNYAGRISLEIKDAPKGAVVDFNPRGPVLVSDVVVMSVDTSNVETGKHEMFVRATPIKNTAKLAPASAEVTVAAVPVSSDSGIAERSANVADMAADVAEQAADVADELNKMQK